MTTVVVRPLSTHAERRACVDLQRDIWGDRFGERVPATLLKVAPRIGGLAVGAFDASSDRLLGFLFGITGVSDGRVIHWSSTLGVDPNARDLGIGRALKEHQRAEMLRLGVTQVYWTYDPLVARNAHLNINRLGALPVEYAVDMYDGSTFGDVQEGIGTDRFVVCWSIGQRSSSAVNMVAGSEVSENSPTQVITVGGPRLSPVTFAGNRVLVEVPWDINELQCTSQKTAGFWRELTRSAFLLAGERGYGVSGFRRDNDELRAYYELKPASPGKALRVTR